VTEEYLNTIQQWIFQTETNFTPIPAKFLVTTNMKEWEAAFILI